MFNLFFYCYRSAALNTGPDCGQFQQNTGELSCQEMTLYSSGSSFIMSTGSEIVMGYVGYRQENADLQR
ncbi:hypothetical protein P4S95_26485 [Aneurinibacillus aneurinilyticus]|uniref:hypothetical protein n=1 Tax=Aneurinibacillus aneurinilyticus TaxID=1391 RepID=UPI002E1F198F|nr:hypothetical protein [Aneurinibacillus aneurinilyticus]